MKHAKTAVLLTARWLVVLAATLVMAAGNVFAESIAPSPEARCTEACAAQCPCCVRAPQSSTPAPLAPNTSTRTSGDFQLVPLVNVLLPLDRCDFTVLPSIWSAPDSAASIPIFVRHCTFLI